MHGTLPPLARLLVALAILAAPLAGAGADPGGMFPAELPPAPGPNPITPADPRAADVDVVAIPPPLTRSVEPDCPASGDAITVLTRKRELWICIDGAPSARYEVSLGQAGLGKRKKGDRRTPLGTYAVGQPRPSAAYGIFIPIAYPTPEQAAQGLTGGDVGIHGPPRKLPEPGYPTTAFDWTLGCVATGSDDDMEAIAAFVRLRQPVVVIR